MVGVIRKRDVLAHPIATVQCFGWPVLLKALVARRQQTFLSLLVESRTFRPPKVAVPELLDDCVGLELSASRIYEALAERFQDSASVSLFFATLAQQEQDHAELLRLCREAASREGWLEDKFAPWRDAVPRLQREMQTHEVSLADIENLPDIMRLVIRIEASEINLIFDGIVAATDSDFVRKLRAFHTAELEHLDYISSRISELVPELAADCRRMKAGYLGEEV